MSAAVVEIGYGPMFVVEHPGQPSHSRMMWTEVPLTNHRQVKVEEGDDLFAALHRFLDDVNASGGAFSLLSGSLSSLSMMTGGRGTETPMTFHGPFEIDGPVAVIGGAGLTGNDQNGSRISHCHGAFRSAAGLPVGGHLIGGKAIAGQGGVLLELTSMSGACFVQRFDAESQFVIFHPEAL